MSVVSLGRVSAAASIIAVFSTGAVVNAQEGYFDVEAPAVAPSLAPLAETSVSEFRALLLFNNSVMGIGSAWAAGFENALVGTGQFGAADIDIRAMSLGTPSLEYLQQYDCVYVWAFTSNYPRAAIGDRLKEYVDAGGGVILAPPAIGSTNTNQPILGGIIEPTYSPLVSSDVPILTSPRTIDFATADLTDKLLEGVTEFEFGISGVNFIAPGLDPTASLVATDTEGVNLLAVSEQRDVVAINVFPGVTPYIPKSAGVYRSFANACSVVAVLEVDIDIMPDSFDNEINLNSHAAIPVAIYGSDFLDVAEIDTSTLSFADAGVKMVGKKGKELCQVKDLDMDLYDDLICKFEAFDLGALDGASTEATVKGSLVGGRKFRGSDSVTIIKE